MISGTAILAACFFAACGGGGGAGATGTQGVVGAASAGAGQATYHAGALPAASGALTVTVPTLAMGINGGTSSFEITASATIVTIYASVQGQTGYWSIPVPPGTTVADVLLTFAQELGGATAAETVPLVIVFEVADALGDISAPQSTPTNITVVGTGAVEVALNWTVPNDLDLHVIDPTGNEIFYGNRTDETSGVELLDLDSNAGCTIDNVDAEHVVWPTGKAPHGMYTVRVDNWSNCQNVAASYTVTVEVTGQAPQTFVGSFPATDPGDEGFEGAGVLAAMFSY